MDRKVVVSLVVQACVTLVLSLEPVPWTHSLTLGNQGAMQVFWKVDNDTVAFEVSIKSHGYVGLGFSPNGGMAGADIVMGWINEEGEVTLQDYHGVGNAIPLLDDQQDYSLSGAYENDTHTILRFYRKLVTCDSQDAPLGSDTLRMIWAYSEVDPGYGDLFWHGIANRGVKSVLLMHPSLPPIEERLGNEYKKWDVTATNVFVNGEKDTLYWCQIVKIPELTTKHQIVGYTPILQPGNEAHVHHIAMYECIVPSNSEKIFEKYVDGKGAECYTPEMPDDWQNYCFAFQVTWVVGSEGNVYPDHFGVPLGQTYGGATYFMLEVHYDNPTLNQFHDSSGVRIYYSDQLRKHDATILTFGLRPTPFQLVPPRQNKFTSYSYCPGECTAQTIPSEGVKIYSVLLHAHTVAKKIRLRHIRQGKELPIIEQDNHYNFNYQTYRILSHEITIMPGDVFMVECEYDTGSRAVPTYGGTTSREEMCHAYAVSYPRISLARCVSSPSLETFFHGLGIRQLNGFDIRTQRTDALLQYSYRIMERKFMRQKRATTVNVNSTHFWESMSISEPESARNMSVGTYLSGKKWYDRKSMEMLEENWKNGDHEVWCTLHGLTSLDIGKHLFKYPRFVPLRAELSTCPLGDKRFSKGYGETAENIATGYVLSLYCVILWTVCFIMQR